MKLVLENIRRFKRAEFVFKKCLNIIKGANTLGKTTIIKALISVFSFPIKRKELIEEADTQGIMSISGKNPQIKLGENRGRISLHLDSGKVLDVFLRNSEIITSNSGDERGILTLALTKESRIYRQVITGDSNFGWILSLLSMASEYEKAYKLIRDLNENLELKLEKFREIQKELNAIDNMKKSLIAELENLSNEANRIEVAKKQLIMKIPQIPSEIKEEYDDLLKQVEEISRRIKIYEAEKKKLQEKLNISIAPLRKVEEELKILKNESKRLNTNLEMIVEEKQKIQENIVNMEAESAQKIQELEDQIERIEEKRIKLAEEKGKYFNMEQIKIRILDLLEKEHAEKVKCPCCGASDIDKEFIERTLNEVKVKIRELNSKLLELVSKKDKLKMKRNNIKKELESYKARLEKLEEEETKVRKELEEVRIRINEYQNRYTAMRSKIESAEKRIKRDIQRYNRLISDEANKLNRIRNRKKKLELIIKEYTKGKEKINRKLGELEGKLQSIRDREAKIKNELNQLENKKVPEIKINDEHSIPINKAIIIYQNWKKTLEIVLEKIVNIINKQKREAMTRFNKSVRRLLREWGFEFNAVYLDEKYFLRIKRDEEIIPLSSLSASERNALAILLQRAVKEAYLPDIPIFALDGTLLDFDPRKANKILDYLKGVAKRTGEAILVTEVSDEDKISIEYLL